MMTVRSKGEIEFNTDTNNQLRCFIQNKNFLFRNHNYKSVIDSINAIEFAFNNTRPEKIVKNFFKVNSKLTINDINNNSKIIDIDDKRSFFVISVGKASVKMLKAIFEIFPKKKIKHSILIMPRGQTLDIEFFNNRFLEKEKVTIIKSSHPIPDNNSLFASKRVIQLIKTAERHTVIIFLISGGTSSLMVYPLNNLTLNDKKKINNLLLKSGADIREINTVRKHLSKIKGGNILKYINNECCVISLILSDVVGDPLDTIGSGLTYFDESTFLNAKFILQKYFLLNLDNESAKRVKDTLNLGIISELPETLKFEDFVQKDINNFIIGNNFVFCNLLLQFLKKCNYNVVYLGSQYDGQLLRFIDDSKKFIDKCLKKNSCILIGGEITNPIGNKKIGKGGRNQEAICHLIDFFCNCNFDDYSVIFLGTDGIDGNSKAAGGLLTPRTIELYKKKQINASKYIARHDSYNLLYQLDSNIFTGYTGTNFNDVYLFVRK